MAKSYLQDAPVKIEIKIYFRIYLIVSKRFLQDLFLLNREYEFYKLRNYENIVIIMLAQQNHRITNGKCSPPIRRFGLRKTAVGLAPFVRFRSTTFCQPWSCCASPYSGWQNVSYLER